MCVVLHYQYYGDLLCTDTWLIQITEKKLEEQEIQAVMKEKGISDLELGNSNDYAVK